MTKIFVPNEAAAGEKRVAATPETVKKMVAAGLEVKVERGAGLAAHFTDEAFAAAGAVLVGERAAELAAADLVLTVSGLAMRSKKWSSGG